MSRNFKIQEIMKSQNLINSFLLKCQKRLLFNFFCAVLLFVILISNTFSQGVFITNGDFETGDLTGFTASGINDGFARIVREGTCFSFNNTRGITFSGDFAVIVRSIRDTTSIGILTSDPFIAVSTLTFKALSENSEGDGAIAFPNPVTFELRILDVSDSVLFSQVIQTNIILLDHKIPVACSGDERDDTFSNHTINLSPFKGQIVKVQFRQHTNKFSSGFFTLVDDIKSNEVVRCGKNNDKVLICHKGNTICVAEEAIAAHLAHGDTPGICTSGARFATSDEDSEDLIVPETILKSYPNPFIDQATIEFMLPETQYVSLLVYNITGKQIVALFDGVAEKNSIYKIRLNAIDLEGGFYIYKLTTEKGDIYNNKLYLNK